MIPPLKKYSVDMITPTEAEWKEINALLELHMEKEADMPDSGSLMTYISEMAMMNLINKDFNLVV